MLRRSAIRAACVRSAAGGPLLRQPTRLSLRSHTIDSGERCSAAAVDALTEDLRAAGLKVIAVADGENERREVKRRSRDFFWYSPILKQTLSDKTGDCVVLPKSEADVVTVVSAALKHQVPLTTRGAGTGNYGQAMPLRGGAVLDMSNLNEIEHFDAERGTIRAGAGAKLEAVEEAARKQGWELRQHPSTRRTAQIGGFVAGGSTGHGALLHGGLSEDGAVLGLRVVTAEPEGPRVLELSGRDVFPVVHAYGTNGIITSVELPLARAQPWVDVTAAFASIEDAAAYALDVANAPAIVKRAVTVLQAPIPHRFLKADSLMHDTSAPIVWRDSKLASEPEARHVCILQCAPTSVGPVERLCAERNGQVTRVIDALKAEMPMYEFGWNHTTLHALKHDKSVTYLQSVLEPANATEYVSKVASQFSTDELMQHLEVINFNGRCGFASMALLWPEGEDQPRRDARLRQILDWHEANGMPVFDPHTHVLEDGGMKQTDWAQLGFKRKVDPTGILNPGKMRAWEEQAATVEENDPRGAFAAAYRIADTSGVQGAAAGKRALHSTASAQRVMLVTGGSTGVGAAVAKMAASQGFLVAIVARREDELKAVASECTGALPIVADVTKRADVERAVQTTIEHFGTLDVLVNNVGRGIAAKPSEVTEEDIDEMITINVKSALFGMQAVLPHFKDQGCGHIINISSRLGRIPSVLPRSAYNWSKHFLNGLTANFRDEVVTTHPGIAISLVSPGLIYTDFGKHALHDGNDMRVQPGGQSKEEVASVIMQVVQTRQPDVFTKVGVKAEMMAYLDALVEDAAPAV